jgi:hypothetical protein
LPGGTAVGKGPATEVVELDTDGAVGAMRTGVDVSMAAALDSVTTVSGLVDGAAVSSGARVSFVESPRTEHDDMSTTSPTTSTSRAKKTGRGVM